jgi:hypothetical protein
MLIFCVNLLLYFVFLFLSTDRLFFLGNDGNAPELGEVKGVSYFVLKLIC